MKDYEIPKYYTDSSMTEEEKRLRDLDMISKDFPL